MTQPVLQRPTLREAPGYWLAGKRLPSEFGPWLADRVQRDDYRKILRTRNSAFMLYLLAMGAWLDTSISLAVASWAVGLLLYALLRTREPTREQKLRLLGWHGVTPGGEPRPPDPQALTGPLERANKWRLLGWSAVYALTAVGIHLASGRPYA